MRTRTGVTAALLAVLGIPPATSVAGAASNDAATTTITAPPPTAVAPTASPTTPTAPSIATGATVAPSVATVATGSTLAPATTTPTPFTVASSLDELVTSFNGAGNQLNADPAQQYPVAVLSPQMFATWPSGEVNVFAGAIADGAIMGGRLDATSGAVREFVVLFNRGIPEANSITVISLAIAAPNQDAAQIFIDYYDMVTTSGELDQAHVWGHGVSIALQEFGDADEDVAIAFMAEAANDETAYANLESLTLAVLAVIVSAAHPAPIERYEARRLGLGDVLVVGVDAVR